MKKLICEQCGANLEIDRENNLFICPACGSKVYDESLDKSRNIELNIDKDADVHIDELHVYLNSNKNGKNVSSKTIDNKRKSGDVCYYIGMVITTLCAIPFLAASFLVNLFPGFSAALVFTFLPIFIIGIVLFAIGYSKRKKET